MIRPTVALLVTLAALAPPSEAVASGGESLQKPAPITATPAAASAQAADAGGEVADYPAPPGSPADVALWRSARAATEAIWVERHRAGTLATRVSGNKYIERLDAAAAKADPKDKDALLQLREKLLKAWQDVSQVMVRPWQVDPTRGCGYPTLAFESALQAGSGGKPGDLAQARGELRDCVEKAQGAVRPLADANRVLDAAWLEADKALRVIEQAGK
jgi:hypothetical protein